MCYLSNHSNINQHDLGLPGKNDINLSLLNNFKYNTFGPEIFILKPISETMVFYIIKSITTNAQGTDGINFEYDLTDVVSYIINNY